LERMAAQYPNMKVFDWYDVVQPQWFRNDGIHYTVEGSAQRALLTAQALVAAYPATQSRTAAHCGILAAWSTTPPGWSSTMPTRTSWRRRIGCAITPTRRSASGSHR